MRCPTARSAARIARPLARRSGRCGSSFSGRRRSRQPCVFRPCLLEKRNVRVGVRCLGVDRKITPPSRERAGDLSRLQGARVLLVENNELNQQVALELLGEVGVQTVVA